MQYNDKKTAPKVGDVISGPNGTFYVVALGAETKVGDTVKNVDGKTTTTITETDPRAGKGTIAVVPVQFVDPSLFAPQTLVPAPAEAPKE
jgi:hypothetical protein